MDLKIQIELKSVFKLSTKTLKNDRKTAEMRV